MIIKIDISDLINQGVGFKKEYEFEENANGEKLDKETVLTKPIKGKVSFMKIEDGVLGEFSVKTEVQLICVRCLKKISRKIDLKYSQEFVFENKIADNIQKKEEQVEGFVVDARNKIDIFPSIRQEILLSLTTKIICKDECKGIKIETENEPGTRKIKDIIKYKNPKH